jgi:ribonuclease P protein component
MLPQAKRLTARDFIGMRPRIIFRGSYIDIAVAENSVTKFACVVAKKRIKRAVDRNKVKRKVYHAIRDLEVKKTKYIIVYPKQTVIGGMFTEIKKEIKQAFDTLQ